MAARKSVNAERRQRLARLSRESDVLRTWGEIAAVLQVSERTALEYHKRYGLPVYRAPGARNRAVTASKERVLAWFKGHYHLRQTANPARGGAHSMMGMLAVVEKAHKRVEAARRAAQDRKLPRAILAPLLAADEELRELLALTCAG